MNILVIGGNRLIGKHLVKHLLRNGHKVTIATRGLTPDNFGNKIERLVIERTSAESIANVLGDRYFDVVYDSLAFSSNDVKCLLDSVKCGKYVMTSTVSVYENYTTDMSESDFTPENYPLKWCWRADDAYGEVKRQAECALYQMYNDIPSIAVRFPFVVGDDDYTKRLHFYVEHIAKSLPMNIDNINEQMSFITSDEAGRFLATFASNNFLGKINASSRGTIAINEIVRYVEDKCGKKAILSQDGDNAPYNGAKTHSMVLDKAVELGFEFSAVKTWIYELLDRIIDEYNEWFCNR